MRESRGFSKYDYSYCPVDGCSREVHGHGKYCEAHYRNKHRTGSVFSVKSTKQDREWVLEAAGPECRVCGRSVYEHNVTEFCQEIARQVA